MEAKINNRRNTRNRYILFTLIALTALFISSCKKDDDGLKFASLPGTYVLTIDHDETNFQYPYYSTGVVIFRGTVDKSYDLRDLASEKDCAWKIVLNSGTPGSSTKYSFQSHSNTDIWWSIGTTYGIGGNQELYLGTEQTNDIPDEDWGRFIIHELTEWSNGGKDIVIESYAYPGYYLENTGHTLTGNGLKFVSKDEPEDATRFRLNGNVVGSTIEGI